MSLSLAGYRQDARPLRAQQLPPRLANREVDRPSPWFAGRVLDPGSFLSRLAVAGMVLVINER